MMISHNEDDTYANVTVDKQGKGVEKQKQYDTITLIFHSNL